MKCLKLAIVFEPLEKQELLNSGVFIVHPNLKDVTIIVLFFIASFRKKKLLATK